MAKWGEGDPRWIVEERADATNVNNWHWSEKNATHWSKDRLKQLLVPVEIEDGSTVITLESFKKLEGEATANNRKAKLIFLFEWELEINFVARVTGSDIEYKGHVEIPNLSDENTADEIDVNVTIDTKGPAEAQIRHVLNKEGTGKIRELLEIYIKELKEEFSKGLILPTDKVKPQVVSKGKTTIVDKSKFMNEVISAEKTVTASSGPLETQSVTISETYKVPPSKLFECISHPQMVKAWASPSEWDFKPNGNFKCFNNAVSGTFLVINENKDIDTTWRLKTFPDNHYANVKFILKDLGDSTQLEIQADNVPVNNLDETKGGLERYYLTNIGRTFGFGSRIF